MDEVKKTIKRAVSELFDIDIDVELTRPEEKFGDYATNVAMQLAPKVSKSPKDIAEILADKISGFGYYKKVEVAGPGFLNITLKDADIWAMAANSTNLPKPLAGQEILVEFGDPNPFKEMHIGHLYSYIVGDSISRLLEAQGAIVRRLSYHGDVGLHVAKAIWGMQQKGYNHLSLADPIRNNVGLFYAFGAKAYDEDETAKREINEINEHIYKQDNDEIKGLYEEGRDRSFGYFKEILADFDIKTDKQYLESQSAPVGIDFVRQNTPKVFIESDGAIIYEGEKVGLHTRVFITSKGLPTYEAKDLGLAELKNKDYPEAVRSVIITANEQAEYFKVMLAALGEFDEKLATKTNHLTHGFISLSSGKMSSRTGEVYSAVSLLLDAQREAKKLYPNSSHESHLAAVKYGFLKHRLGTDIVYDIAESVSMEGNSGPYLQYAHARAKGILSKTKAGDVKDLQPAERSLARKIGEYPEVIAKASVELMPHIITNYLYELAQAFNRFYESNRVSGDEREPARAKIVESYANTLAHGLNILNIAAPDKV